MLLLFYFIFSLAFSSVKPVITLTFLTTYTNASAERMPIPNVVVIPEIETCNHDVLSSPSVAISDENGRAQISFWVDADTADKVYCTINLRVIADKTEIEKKINLTGAKYEETFLLNLARTKIVVKDQNGNELNATVFFTYANQTFSCKTPCLFYLTKEEERDILAKYGKGSMLFNVSTSNRDIQSINLVFPLYSLSVSFFDENERPINCTLVFEGKNYTLHNFSAKRLPTTKYVLSYSCYGVTKNFSVDVSVKQNYTFFIDTREPVANITLEEKEDEAVLRIVTEDPGLHASGIKNVIVVVFLPDGEKEKLEVYQSLSEYYAFLPKEKLNFSIYIEDNAGHIKKYTGSYTPSTTIVIEKEEKKEGNYLIFFGGLALLVLILLAKALS